MILVIHISVGFLLGKVSKTFFQNPRLNSFFFFLLKKIQRVKKGFELHVGKENPYNQYIQEVITKYETEKKLKIPGIILNDVQRVLGHDANLIVAANAQDSGISILQTKSNIKSPQKTIVVESKTLSRPRTIIVEDNSPKRKQFSRTNQKTSATPRTLTLGSPSTIIVSP